MLSISTQLAGPRLTWAKAAPGEWRCRYGVGSALQISPTQALLIVNRRVTGEGVIDFEDGADGFVFDSVDGLERLPAVSLARNEPGVHPRTGRQMIMVSFLGCGGFVPWGARRDDGTPHPAAGTGFALVTYVGIPANLSERHPPRDDIYQYQELVQLRFDGKTLGIADRCRFSESGLLEGHSILNRPINNAIADGLDLVSGLVVGPMTSRDTDAQGGIATSHGHRHRVLGRNFGCGLCRWRYGAAGWRPVELVPVSGPDMAFEPSVVRDVDGSLLMSVRGENAKAPPGEVADGLENTYHHFRVYRSADSGRTWEPRLHIPLMRSHSPVVINTTAQGSPFLTANPLGTPPLRKALGMWPLSQDRRSVGDMIPVLDGDCHFGRPRPFAPPHEKLDNDWWIDHPIGETVRLADGRWHTLLCFRVTDAVAHMTRQGPVEQAGLWIEEVVDARPGALHAPWRFE